MSLHKLTAGSGYTYLTRQVAAQDTDGVGYSGLGEYYSQKGESPGQWMGRGGRGVSDFPQATAVTEAQMCALFGEGRHPEADRISAEMARAGHDAAAIEEATRLGSPFRIYDKAPEFRRVLAERFAAWNTTAGLPADWPIPVTERARIRTEAATEMFTEQFGRPPADARELSGFVARESRQATTAVAGYDLTFSPVKSVSTLWAVAPMDLARQIEAAHDAAVADTLTWLENSAAYTRSGRNGVQQVEVQGLIAAAFTHRDSRAGDPDLHTHVAISNKVQSLDGRWLAADGRPLHKMTVAASERYNTRLEAHLVATLGVAFAERTGTDPTKRPVREIVGVHTDLASAWSSRRAEIDVRRAALSAKFQADHGRTPNVVEAIRLAQQATLDTREAKHEPRSYAEQRAAWAAEALNTLGSPEAVQAMVQRSVNRAPSERTVTAFSEDWAKQAALTATETVAMTRATWQTNHVRAEVERQARTAGIPLRDLDRAVDAAVAVALSSDLAIPLGAPPAIVEPAALCRSDGSSVYSTAGTQLYTSAAIVEAEKTLLAVAVKRGGHALPAATVDLALLESTANGVDLNPGQVQLVRDMATSGAPLQLALAPAGTGKTTAMRVLARAWASDGGTVIGLAPSAAAAAVLQEEIGGHTDTLAKLNHSLATGPVPEWVAGIGPKTLVILDEAGMAGTTELAAAVTYIHGRGGSVRLIGDDQQLAAIGAGGVLRDIAETAGAVTLSQVMRFSDTAEGAASLALRAGDTAAIGFYLDNTRVHVGDAGTVTEQAYRAWAADRGAGLDSVMLAPTRDLVDDLNARARRDRLEIEGTTGRQVALGDGSSVSAGDVIISRRNDRRLPITPTDWVKNGDRWTVLDVTDGGALQVRHLGTNRTITLPAGYVAEHVALGYASTVHAAQGITADTSHTVATGQESRQVAYVALTRGRAGNHLYLTTAGDGEDHSITTRDALLPPTAADIFARILQRDGAQTSASTAQREQDNPARLLQAAVDQYSDALTFAAIQHLGEEAMAVIDAAAEHVLPGVANTPAYPTLRGHLALLSLSGEDPLTALTNAAQKRELDTAHDVSAVLDWRLDPTMSHGAPSGPLPWLPGVPQRLVDDETWGDYLQQRAANVSDLATTVATTAGGWTPTTAPPWAAPLVDVGGEATADPAAAPKFRPGRRLITDLAVWRAASGTDDTDLRATGDPQIRAAETRHQRSLNNRAAAVLGAPNAATNAWANTADAVDRRITSDPYWPTLAGRLAAANRAGLNVEHLVAAAGAESPLPDEHPAAALWWRLSRHLAPAALNATASSTPATLRPDWTPVLADVVGPQLAARVLADAAWPGLVAAVDAASDAGWNEQTVLSTAYELLLDGQDHAPVAGHELATALTWRTAMLAESNTYAHSTAGGSGRAEPPDLLGPEDLLTDSDADAAGPPPYEDGPELSDQVSAEDEQWLASVDWMTDPAGQPQPDATTNDRQAQVPDLGDHSDDQAAVSSAVPHTPDADDRPSYPVIPARIADLNEQALAFFTDHYQDAWAAGYLTERLGSDLVDDGRFHPGYAPAGWTNLTDHLRAAGATDEELLAAGLATEAKTGRLIDRFRDRLILPIYNGEQVHGFVGRRNPATDDAGPKYLNTADTALFTKGDQLFGATEGAAALAAGATPVLIEGPIDAIAVTLAGDGRYVGLAPLGTAFTDSQADGLTNLAGPGKPQPLVATDGDAAGRKAAARAYWLLTERGSNPNHLPMPENMDPAQIFQTLGTDALRDLLDGHQPLATTLVDARIDQNSDRLDTPEGKVAAGRAAAQIIAPLPPDTWQQHIDHVTSRIDPSPGWLLLEVLEAGQDWTTDRHGITRRHLNEKDYLLPARPDAVPADPTRTSGYDTGSTAAFPSTRWAELAQAIHPTLLNDPGWPHLRNAMDRAHRAGYDVAAQLPVLAAQAPLPDTGAAHALRLRLIQQTATAVTPVSAATQHLDTEADAQAAAARLAHPHEPPSRIPAASSQPSNPQLRADRAATEAARQRLGRAQAEDVQATPQPAARKPPVPPTRTEQVKPPEVPPTTRNPRR